MYDIIFFTSNINKGGLDIENVEEIEYLKKYYNILVLPYIYIKNVSNIVTTVTETIYIDFINNDISLISNVSSLQNKIIFKYKGRYLHNEIQDMIQKLNNSNITIITTCTNITNINSIKYWSLNFSVLDNILSPNIIQYSDKYNTILQTKSYKYMYVGRSSYQKGIQQTINAFKQYYKENKNIILILILIGTINMEFHENIYIFNEVPYNDCLYMIKNYCDCLIMASNNEGFGRVAIEALYYKKLLISTNQTMLYDIMPINTGVLYLENNSQQSIYNALQQINTYQYDNENTTKCINYLKEQFNNFYTYFN